MTLQRRTLGVMSIPPGLEKVVSLDPEKMGGAICFVGTRIPISIFFDNLRAGVSLDSFFENYPDISRQQVEAVLEWEHSLVLRELGISEAA